MKASSKLMKLLSVSGLSLAFALGCAWQLQGQQSSRTSGAFAPPTAAETSQTQQATQLPSKSQETLLKARQALATGDIAAAKSLVETARQLPTDPQASDSPAMVDAMIARHSQLMQMYDSSPDYNQHAAMFLLEQADGLVTYGDFTTAQSLVNEAKNFNIQFKPGDISPAHVTRRMQQMRSMASNGQKAQASRILSQAQFAFDKGQLDLASQLISRVKALNLPEDVFEDDTILPWELELKIQQARKTAAATGNLKQGANTIQRADYYPELDTTRNMQVAGTEEDPFTGSDARAKRLYDSGISALSLNDRKGALDYFRMAWQYRDQLDQATQQDLQTKLSELATADIKPTENIPSSSKAIPASFAQEQVTGVDEDLQRQMFSNVLQQRSVAQRMVQQRNPRGALNHMRLVRDEVQNSELNDAAKTQLIAVVEREISEMEKFIEQNIGEIENMEMNEMRRNAVTQDRQNRDDVERKIQSMVNDFNRLLKEQRYEEARYIAQQARDLAPNEPAVRIMYEKAQLQANMARYEATEEAKAKGFLDEMEDVARKGIRNVGSDRPIEFDVPTWEKLAQNRAGDIGAGSYRSPAESRIWSSLEQQQIEAEFPNTPLSEALSILAERAGVNIVTDGRALQMENVSLDSPVLKSITQPISVKSALNLILADFGLVFKVENESVVVTNKEALQANPDSVTYYVGDLVVPVPDFSGNSLNMQFLGPNQPNMEWSSGRMNNGFSNNNQNGNIQPVSFNQQAPETPGFGGGPSWTGSAMPHTSRGPMYNSWGPKGVSQGGITEQDFEELMDLIQETIDPDSWEANGGNGRMRPFPSTLSLIVTQTQENQDRIQALLTRLRELSDVQIVVEVRFLTLRDDFFERIGVDLDLQFNDNSGFTVGTLPDNASQDGGTRIVGRSADLGTGIVLPGSLDIPLTQNSFGGTIPTFGVGSNLTEQALNFGFAILSDIEVFFLLQAAKGDNRSNVTQAPVVTMFNGQSASVFSGEQRPFVTSIIPVVGDFAAAQQPVITILPEGTQLNVRAVASSDRRFVKMTLVPFFSRIQQVDTFQFSGERRVRRGGGSTVQDVLDAIVGGGDGDPLGNDELEVVESGTTVQLPVFANTTVTTTVSVPDGGTVLLGGIKTMQEERIEQGVPFLSNIPYVNRLFKNVGIGRSSQSLMMMVTPRIIIQEEEEKRQITAGQ